MQADKGKLSAEVKSHYQHRDTLDYSLQSMPAILWMHADSRIINRGG